MLRLTAFCILPRWHGEVTVERWGFRISGDHGALEESEPTYRSELEALLAGNEACVPYGAAAPIIW